MLKPFIFKNWYYSDEETKMISGYIAKTWLASLIWKSKEDDYFETLIWGVGWLKCLRIILENIYKELKATQKKLSDLREAKLVEKLIPNEN